MNPRETIKHSEIAAAVPLLEVLGYTFEIDWDDSIVFGGELRDDADELVRNMLAAALDTVTARVQSEARQSRALYHHGPYHGLPAHHCHGVSTCYKVGDDYVSVTIHHHKRGEWYAYRHARDGRAFLIASATSRKKLNAELVAAFYPEHNPEEGQQ